MVNVHKEDLAINNINKEFLFGLFIDLINKKFIIKETIKNSNLIKREDYSNDLEYDLAIQKISNSVKILNDGFKDKSGNLLPVFIQYKSGDLKNWNNFLKFL